jgi:hypothetical protein
MFLSPPEVAMAIALILTNWWQMIKPHSKLRSSSITMSFRTPNKLIDVQCGESKTEEEFAYWQCHEMLRHFHSQPMC